MKNENNIMFKIKNKYTKNNDVIKLNDTIKGSNLSNSIKVFNHKSNNIQFKSKIINNSDNNLNKTKFNLISLKKKMKKRKNVIQIKRIYY
jgi:hypothetical protein